MIAGWEARWDREKSSARLAWIESIRVVYGAGLRLAGITALERMERLTAKDAGGAGRAASATDEEDLDGSGTAGIAKEAS